ncbi:MAG TPA: nucleotidyltransferase domain-containing protein [Ignavibacteria bacterium]|nr:nucleotidyltransferase domain-containing protein [Ignavibacteria bacterium]
MGKQDILKYLSDNKDFFEKNFNIVKIGIFGSFAKDTNNAKSDIDLIIEFKPNTPNLFNKKQELRLLIKSIFGKDVDICREKYIKPYYKKVILSEAIYV